MSVYLETEFVRDMRCCGVAPILEYTTVVTFDFLQEFWKHLFRCVTDGGFVGDYWSDRFTETLQWVYGNDVPPFQLDYDRLYKIWLLAKQYADALDEYAEPEPISIPFSSRRVSQQRIGDWTVTAEVVPLYDLGSPRLINLTRRRERT